MFVMGTAGHVDHGKSTLVTALSGIDPDRLPEEKERGMTIDLGFAWMTTNSGQTIGIVDVPGHERFVKNMIAGVGAIDFVLLVIAADDGWMPQTEEHLAILRFLRVPRGIAVITKKSLADPDWLELVKTDVREHVSNAFPAQAETAVVAVDSISGDGLPELRDAIDQMVKLLPTRPDIGKPRLYVDRVFAMAGRGAVVTGTLIDGTFSVGQSVGIVPRGGMARIREMQIHKQKVQTAAPGQRLAVNLAGVEVGALSRGQCLVNVDDGHTVDRIWAHVAMLPDARLPLDREREVLIMLGTAEPAAVAHPVEDVIAPGAQGLCELRLKESVKARLKDRFVLRWPTPQVTIGGGEVLDFAGPRRKHQDASWHAHLRARIDAPLAVYRKTELSFHGYRLKSAFLTNGSFSAADISADLSEAIADGFVIESHGWLYDSAWVQKATTNLLGVLGDAHAAQPHLQGLNLSELCDRAGLAIEPIAGVVARLVQDGTMDRTGDALHLPGHRAALPASWKTEAESLWRTIEASGLQPPDRSELEAASEHARAIIGFWTSSGQAVSLGDGMLLTAEALAASRAKVVAALRARSSLGAGQLREVLGTTRKFTVPILEWLDREGVTQRVGDERVLVETSAEGM